jgi:hypothetical protein
MTTALGDTVTLTELSERLRARPIALVEEQDDGKRPPPGEQQGVEQLPLLK